MWFSVVFLADTEEESLLIWKTLKTCQTQCLDIIVLRIYFSICVYVVSHKQDKDCLLKLDISYQVYESMVLLFWCSGELSWSVYYGDVSTCEVDWCLCAWSIIQTVGDEFGLKNWKRQIGCSMLMTSNISKSRQVVWMLCFKKKILEMLLMLHMIRPGSLISYWWLILVCSPDRVEFGLLWVLPLEP